MWIAKIQYSHDCILGNRCQEFNVSLQSIGFNVYKEDGDWISSSLHYMTGSEEHMQQLAFYKCIICKKPYCGGERVCEEAEDPQAPPIMTINMTTNSRHVDGVTFCSMYNV